MMEHGPIILEARVAGPTEFVLGLSFTIPIEINYVELPRELREDTEFESGYQSLIRRTRIVSFSNTGKVAALPIFQGDRIRAFLKNEFADKPLETREANAIHLLDDDSMIKARYAKPGYD